MRSALFSLLIASTAAAQSPCFDDDLVPPWNSQSVGAATGAVRQLAAVEACAAGGVATPDADAWHGLYQGAGNGGADLVATIEDIEPGGRAGLVLSRDPRRADTAGMQLIATRDDDGIITAQARFRPVQGAPADAFGSAAVEVDLPVTARIWRDGDFAHAAVIAGGDETVLLSIDVGGTDLDFQALAGVVAGGAIDASPRTASFSGLYLQTEFEPPPDVACVEPSVLSQTGTTLVVTGAGLDRVTRGRALGADAEVIEAGHRMVSLAVPPVGPGEGDLDLVQQSTHRIERTIVAGGQPIIRGDLNLDGTVDRADLSALDRWLAGEEAAPCVAPADVDGDGDVDGADRKRLARFLRWGRTPPAAPFPAAGIVAGSVACDPRPGPVVTGIVDATGAPVRGPLGEGDVVFVEGANLPVNGSARFGHSPARINAASTAERLMVRIGVVPAAGIHCLTLGDGEPGRSVAFGRQFGGDPVARPDLCLDLRASRLEAASVSHVNADGQIFLPIRSADWDRSQPVDLAIDLPFDRVEGGARGARSARLRYTPPVGTAGGPIDYETWLFGLARATAEALEEGDDECGCDIAVYPLPNQQGMSFAPCAPTPPPPPVDPTPFDPNLPLEKPNPSLGGAAIWAPPPNPTCESQNPNNLRLWAWCQFVDVTRIKEELEHPWHDDDYYLGLPVFEGFRPLTSILAQQDWVIDPRDQPVELKYVMVEPALHYEMKDKKYYSPCGIAARAHYCANHPKAWMPMLSQGKRIVKNFFVTEGALPQGRPLSDYYSYVPKDYDQNPPAPMERQYLVGMHVSVSITKASVDEAYFKWATFWVPPPQGATHTRDGRPLSAVYNPNCVNGSGVDSPVQLQGTVWGNFEMCVQANADDHCGNPWGPADECTPNPAHNLDCQDCHEMRGRISWNQQSGYGAMHVGWMTYLGNQAADAQECRNYIVEMEDAGTPVYADPSCDI